MARKQTRTLVAPTPVIGITITHDQVIAGGALVQHDDRVTPQQAAAHHVATTVAAALNRPVKATATDPLGRVKMVIHPDGHVTDVEPLATDAPAAPVRAPGVSAFASPGEPQNPWLKGSGIAPPPPPPPPAAPDRLLDEQEDLDLTVGSMAPESADDAATATAVFSDGQIVELVETILIGRNPASSDQAVSGVPIRIKDHRRSISRSHFALGVDAQGVWIQDLRSTNGTALSAGGGFPEKILPGQKVRCPDGSVVHFGDHQVSIKCAAQPG